MLFERRAGKPKPLEEQNQSPRRAPARERSQTNELITPEGALSVSAVLAAFTIISEDISSLPLMLYQRTKKGKDRAWASPYYGLMHDSPNPEHTSMVFREIMMGHLLAWGNFYGQMIWDDAGVVKEIWPLRPDRMAVSRVNGARRYTYMTSEGKERKFTSDDILHIPAFGFDGLIGYSRISLARNSIGLSIAAEKFGSKFFANDARPGVVLKHPGKLSDAAYAHLASSWNDEHQGSSNSWKPAILEEGLDVETVGIPPEDAQFLQTRQFQVAEIARIFRVPPHMIGDVTNSTSWGTGIDSQEQGYVGHTLRPWTVRIEQSLSQQLLLGNDRQYMFFEHLFDGLLRGDITTRYTAYVQALNNGFMSPNEVRGKENLNSYDGGDEYYRPLNMTSATAPAAPPAAPAAALMPGPFRAAMEPLYQDAVKRIMARECNDLSGAVKRTLAKGMAEEFDTWALGFYSDEHREFMRRQLGPLLHAQQHVYGVDGFDRVETFINSYLDNRLEWLQSAGLTQIEDEISAWRRDKPEAMALELMKMMEA